METIHLQYPLHSNQPVPPVALAIGYFDGVHRGHQAVIRQARRMAQERGIQTAVMTFHPHPREVLGRVKMSRYLTPLPEKLEQFAQLGVDRTYVMRFDRDFAGLSRESFVEEVLIPLRVQAVAVGFNFRFGHRAQGCAQDLGVLAKNRFLAQVVMPVGVEGVTVSSTHLRHALGNGEIELARRILGRPYTVKGTVVHGDKRGRTIGFPTANVQPAEPYLIPKNGVYVVQVRRNGRIETGVMNIGTRPTFDDPVPRHTLEVHLFDVNEDLYGQTLEVAFLHFLREEKRFDSVDALVKQIQEDVAQARNWLTTHGWIGQQMG
ncbi:bifunctional riboflavin kinase/FAD synthetase [Polycladomyces sp. WAk]|uniref:Riboflavin biosynthesis protein n=1 Tax=Polycladomyces zharkentensis TaxID=2807616 RepID=A0ABS2WIJ4_9BACL|nr:bifunctional riboflavin kinase/FAD synthetase [Polycladomyces sp. WAk]MBN2909373.1 bifunctional riboflavin kinase/FAD synthetase [Polycladomyces sp. WAk]